MNIFEALRHDHDKQRELVDALIQTHGDTRQRHKLMDELKTELEDHAKFEERYFYNPLMFDDLTHEKARHSVAEHHEIDELIEQLEDTAMSSSAWLVAAKKLHHLVHHHLSEEEHEVFQLAGKALTEGQKESLAKQYNDAMH
ncbi:hemerythrin domain-containing protein [Pseudoalteromonas agarivorans]|uniref:hemerythrin domain-containing protein n=1 Tax=Pseudoalteromonas agarivorans TaxID=176102 RepID=UPI002118C874|nr:hemerythrin domain-containing protein [Pseudoalteromonas agarivorans]MCQ8820068.1 hemerythrin domain-containing protein [Pseudoalteromonas agarivorans]